MDASCILVVDDYEPLRFLKRHFLARAGFTVAEAATGEEALDLVASRHPDLVLLDVNLPDMRGDEVCRRIKARAPLPVVFTSALEVPAEFRQTADDCLVGVDSERLVRTARALLSRGAQSSVHALPVLNGGNQCLPTRFAPAARSSREEIERQARVVSSALLATDCLDNIPWPAAVLNENRQIVYCNPAMLLAADARQVRDVLGLRPGELLKCLHSDEVSGCGTTEFCQTCGAVRSILEGFGGERAVRNCRLTRRRHGRQEALDLLVSVAPLQSAERLVLCCLTDVSAEKRRRALERIFFHDVLGTVESLRGLTGEMLRVAVTGEAAEYAERIGRSAARLTEEVRSQRQLLEAETLELAVTPVAVRAQAVLARVVEECAALPAAHGRTLRLEPASDDLVLTTDEVLLRRVLANMVRNALEAVPPGATVTLGCRSAGERVEFRVYNPGVMPKQVQLQMFQRSFSTKGEGRGLGAYSMKLLSERYLGGSVAFRSTPEEGTTFFVRVPKAPAR